MENKKRNWLLWIIVILLAVNLTVIGWHTFGSRWRQPDHGRGPELMFRKMGFDNHQVAKAMELVKLHFERIGPLKDSLASAKKELFMLAGNPDADQVIAARLDRVEALNRSIDSLTVLHFRAVRAMATPEQTRKIDQFLERMAKGEFGRRGMMRRPAQ